MNLEQKAQQALIGALRTHPDLVDQRIVEFEETDDTKPRQITIKCEITEEESPGTGVFRATLQIDTTWKTQKREVATAKAKFNAVISAIAQVVSWESLQSMMNTQPDFHFYEGYSVVIGPNDVDGDRAWNKTVTIDNCAIAGADYPLN